MQAKNSDSRGSYALLSTFARYGPMSFQPWDPGTPSIFGTSFAVNHARRFSKSSVNVRGVPRYAAPPRTRSLWWRSTESIGVFFISSIGSSDRAPGGIENPHVVMAVPRDADRSVSAFRRFRSGSCRPESARRRVRRVQLRHSFHTRRASSDRTSRTLCHNHYTNLQSWRCDVMSVFDLSKIMMDRERWLR